MNVWREVLLALSSSAQITNTKVSLRSERLDSSTRWAGGILVLVYPILELRIVLHCFLSFSVCQRPIRVPLLVRSAMRKHGDRHVRGAPRAGLGSKVDAGGVGDLADAQEEARYEYTRYAVGICRMSEVG